MARIVELHDAIAFGIAHLVGEDGGAFGPDRGGAERGGEVFAEDQVVAQH